MIYIKSNKYNITNNYNGKVKMILRSGAQFSNEFLRNNLGQT